MSKERPARREGRRAFSKQWMWLAEVAVRMYLDGRLSADSAPLSDAFWSELHRAVSEMLGAFSTLARRDMISDALIVIVREIRREHESPKEAKVIDGAPGR